MALGEGRGVGPRRLVHIREHPCRGAVDNQVGLGAAIQCCGIADGMRMLFGCAGDKSKADSELLERVRHGFGGSAGAEDKGLAMPWMEKGLQRLGESWSIGVVTNHPAPYHLHAIDGANGFRLWVQAIHHGDDLLFIWDSNIESKESFLSHPLGQVVGSW